MNGELLFEALGEAAPVDILRAGRAGGFLNGKRKLRPTVRVALIAAAIALLLAGAVGAKMVLGIWNDRWVQTPAPDPAAVVREAIDNQQQKEYTVRVQVDFVREDGQEADKVWTGAADSMLALQNGWADPENVHKACADRTDFTAVYAEYTVEYDHTRTFYPDGVLGQWFYLVRGKDGNWEIWDSCDPISLDPAQEETEQPQTGVADTDGAVEETVRMVKAWEQFDDVSAVTVEKAECSRERKARAVELLSGSSLAEAEGWTEAYLIENLAAVEITYTMHPAPDQPDPQPVTETAVYYLLRDPATGQWRNSEITGFMDGKE